MPLITSKRVWTQQPQQPTRISQKWRNLGFKWVISGADEREIVSGERLTRIGSPTQEIISSGRAIATEVAGNAYQVSINSTPSNEATIVWFGDFIGAASQFATIAGIPSGTSSFDPYFCIELQRNRTSIHEVSLAYGTDTYNLCVGSAIITSQSNVCIVGSVKSYDQRLYVNNGTLNTWGAYIANLYSPANKIVEIGDSNNLGRNPNTRMSLFAISDVGLNDTLCRELLKNPWQLLEKQDRRIWIPSASGGATITCAPGNATTAGITAGISSATTIACTPGGASTAGVACALPIKIACNVGNATPTGIACSLQVVVQCNAGTATTAGVSAGIALDSSITISCNAGTATTSGVSASFPQTLSCTPGNATTAGASATFPQAISCNVGTATTAGITAQVEIAGQIVIGCNAGTATTAGVSANISSAFVLACNAGTATTLGATAYFPQSLQCSPGNAIAVGIDATFTVAGPTTIVCNVGNATASGISFSFGGTLVDAPNGSGPTIIRPQTNRPLNVGGIRI